MKQQPMARKLLALCLSLLLVLAFVPTAWAEGEKAQVGEKNMQPCRTQSMRFRAVRKPVPRSS